MSKMMKLKFFGKIKKILKKNKDLELEKSEKIIEDISLKHKVAFGFFKCDYCNKTKDVSEIGYKKHSPEKGEEFLCKSCCEEWGIEMNLDWLKEKRELEEVKTDKDEK